MSLARLWQRQARRSPRAAGADLRLFTEGFDTQPTCRTLECYFARATAGGTTMTLDEILDQAIALLQRRGVPVQGWRSASPARCWRSASASALAWASHRCSAA